MSDRPSLPQFNPVGQDKERPRKLAKPADMDRPSKAADATKQQRQGNQPPASTSDSRTASAQAFLKAQVKENEQIITELKNLLEQKDSKHHQTLSNARDETKKLRESSSGMEKRIQELEKKAKRLEELERKCKSRDEELSKLSGEIQLRDRDIAQSKTDLDEKERKIRDLQSELQSLTGVLTEFQGSAFQQLAKQVSRNLTDDRIHKEFETLFSDRVDTWCADFVTRSPVDDPGRRAVRAALVSRGILVADRAGELDISSAISCVWILRAMMNHAMCSFLRDPFFILRAVDSKEGSRLHRSLEASYHTMQGLGFDGVSAWRKETLDALSKTYPLQAKSDCLRTEIDAFVRDARPLLDLDEGNDEDLSDLRDIFLSFALFALDIWRLDAGVAIRSKSGPWRFDAAECAWPDRCREGGGNESILLIRPSIGAMGATGSDGRTAAGPLWARAILWPRAGFIS